MFNFNCDKKDGTSGCFLTARKSKKQIAIADREVELLSLAKSLVREQGFANLTMDKLTAASPYSKGTIYNHFCSKEDLILALCIQSLKNEAQFFARATSFEGSSREKIVAMHVAYHTYARLEPELSTCAIMAKTPWVLEKASAERVAHLNQTEEEVIGGADAMVAFAVENGDLRFTPGLGTDAIVFANWSIAFGSNALARNASNSRCIARLKDPFSILHNVNMLLDGMAWKPLSSEWDYRKTWKKVEQELFQEEIAYLENQA